MNAASQTARRQESGLPALKHSHHPNTINYSLRSRPVTAGSPAPEVQYSQPDKTIRPAPEAGPPARIKPACNSACRAAGPPDRVLGRQSSSGRHFFAHGAARDYDARRGSAEHPAAKTGSAPCPDRRRTGFILWNARCNVRHLRRMDGYYSARAVFVWPVSRLRLPMGQIHHALRQQMVFRAARQGPAITGFSLRRLRLLLLPLAYAVLVSLYYVVDNPRDAGLRRDAVHQQPDARRVDNPRKTCLSHHSSSY